MSTAATMDEAAGAAAPSKNKRKLLLIGLAVLLLAGAGAGAWFTGVLPRLLGREAEATADGHGHEDGHGHAHADKPGAKPDAKAEAAPAFLDLPDIIANLNAGRRAAFVKLKAKLELARPEDAAALQAAMPRVIDLFQSYLREMRPEELRGTAGTYRLREELIARTNIAAHPARVVNVLFTELIVQ